MVESNRFGLLGDIRDGAQHLGLLFTHLGQRLLVVKLAAVTESEDDLLPSSQRPVERDSKTITVAVVVVELSNDV